ncbi:hypothetical protein BH11PLA1_BH11PLA1_16950 [soil metagenome]
MNRRPRLLVMFAGTLVTAGALAQPAPTEPPLAPPTDPARSADPERDGQPPQPPQSQPGSADPMNGADPSGARSQPAVPAAQPLTPPEEFDALGRRKDDGIPIKLSFLDVPIKQLISFIAETTGKTVLPQPEILSRTITVLSDRAISKSQALDLVFLALQQRNIAVIESESVILLRDNIDVERGSLPVLGPNQSTLTRPDVGNLVQKVFALKYATASNVGEVIKNSLPDAKLLAIDAESNQVIVTAQIIILQRIEKLIDALDRVQAAAPVTETFKLKVAEADVIAQNIRDLYGAGTNAQQQNNQQRFPGQGGVNRFQQNGGGGGRQPGANPAAGGGTAAATSTQLRVTSNVQQNAVTVLAEPDVLDSIRRQITQEWDKPLDEGTEPKVYDLKNTDPLKMKAVLDDLFSSTSSQNNQNNAARTGTAVRLAGQFRFQAIPEANRLIVISRSKDNISQIDKIIEELDQPLLSGSPEIVELKHANAEELAEQVNALLARSGTLAQVRRTDTSLTEQQAGVSPFAQTDAAATTAQNQQSAAATMTYWWQNDRTATTDNSGASNLIAKARVVQVPRSNSLMVLAQPEYKRAIVELIDRLDRPGRQVLISAIVVELSGENATALGIRFSNSAINPTRAENSIGTNANSNFTGTAGSIADSLFDTSVLNLGVNINVLLQALQQNTDVRILSEPKIFTGDNQEAEFFDGQDIPFITESQPNTLGNLVQSFDYRAVGIALRVRPRITPERDVDLKVNLQLSSITPGNTLFGGAIVDRRETTTQLIVQDGQTIVISGIIRSEDSDVHRKVPILGDIPFLGAPFNSIEKVRTNTELVAFITPIVVNNRQESDRVNDKPRERLREMRNQLVPQEFVPPKPDSAPLDTTAPNGTSTQPAKSQQ